MPQDYAEQVDDILALLRGSLRLDRTASVRGAVPGEAAAVQVWILGSSGGQSAAVAGRNGLRFAANYHVSPATVLEAADGYRAAFRPSAELDRPYLSVSADVVVAGDEATARDLATGYGLWVRSIRSGEGAIEYPTPDEARSHNWTDEDRALVADRIDTQFVGSPGPGRQTSSSSCATPPAPTSSSSRPSRMTTPTGCAPMSCWRRSGTDGDTRESANPRTGGDMSVAVVVGNPKPRSRTFQAAHIVAERLSGRPADLSIDLTELGAALLDWSDPGIAELVAAVQASDLVVVASPTYKATYTGLLKLFLDRFGAGSLTGTAVPVMLGGHWKHALAPELLLKPVLVEIGATCPTAGLFLLDSEFEASDTLDSWLERARPQVAATTKGLA